MNRKKTNPDFLNGVPELLLLRILARKPMHGYAVVQAIKLQTQGALKFGEGSIYPILHRLESEGILAATKSTVRGRQRVEYHVTPKGLKRLAASTSLWNEIVGAVSKVLGKEGESHGYDAAA